MRKTVKDTFSPGTTIDGTRIDNAISKTRDRMNSVQPNDLEKYQKPFQISWGWEPSYGTEKAYYDVASTSLTHRSLGPFCPIINATAAPVPDPTNPIRIKGTADEYVPVFPLGVITNQLVWSVKFGVSEPVILTDVVWCLQTDDNRNPDTGILTYEDDAADPLYEYLIGCPPYGAGNPQRDFQLVVEVASTYAPEQSLRNAVVARKRDIPSFATRFMVERVAAGVAYTDMLPAFPGGILGGLWLEALDLRIPIPENAKVKISLVLPIYELDGGGNIYTNWATYPVVKQAYSGMASFLKGCSRG